MTGKIVLENMKYKPMRTALSVLLIAVPVTLILTLVGLSRGMIQESQRRQRGVGADILFRPPGSSAISLSGAPLPEKFVQRLEEEPHVVMGMGMMSHPISGFTYAAGADLDTFNRMSGGFKYLDGGPFQNPDDVLIDDFYARQVGARAGTMIRLLNRDWHVAGVVEGGKLSHIVLPLRVLQDLTSNTGKISQVFLKLDNPSNTGAVMERLKEEFPDYSILSMEEMMSQLNVDNVPQLRAFIRVVEGIGIVIGFAVVSLSMYMAVLQRTREIGILKSLGASRFFILSLILLEALVMGLGGTILGILMTFGVRSVILTLAPASYPQAIVPDWWPVAALITLVGATLGAMYPGMSAVRQDAIEALAYE